MASITMKDMLDAGAHFGHQTQRWNPRMKPYVYTSRGGIHIIDLQKSVAHAKHAGDFVKKVAAKGGRMIFVGTKKQAVDTVKEAAEKCGQYHITKRWLGGTLTNFTTIKTSIDRLKKIDHLREKGDLNFYSKKERSKIEKEYGKLSEYLDGIRDMKGSPAVLFVVDLNKEHIAVAEANRLGIPVVGIADTNCDPGVVEYPIPGNDDAIRSIKLFANYVADSYIEGAKNYKEHLKVEAEQKKAAEANPEPKAKAQPTTGGPDVVKVTKGRKLVAAGTADAVEIEMELEKAATEKTEETPTEETKN